jgi:hypothetical protein
MLDAKEELKKRQSLSKIIKRIRGFELIHDAECEIIWMKGIFSPIKALYLAESTSEGYCVCSTGNQEINQQFIASGCMEYLWTSVNKKYGNTYKVNSALVHYDKRNYKNYEFVQEMYEEGVLQTKDMDSELAYLWNLDEESVEKRVFYWFMKKLQEVRENSIKQTNILVNISIAKNMLRKERRISRVVDLLEKFMLIQGEKIFNVKKESFKLLLEFQAAQLPFD